MSFLNTLTQTSNVVPRDDGNKTFAVNEVAVDSRKWLKGARVSHIKRGGHWGLRYCGNGQFFMRYFGNSDLKLRYCDILKTCEIRFLAFCLKLSSRNFRPSRIFFQFLVVSKTAAETF